jgi:hypothetical protein
VSSETDHHAAERDCSARLARELEGAAPPAGWQAGVWAGIARRRSRQRWGGVTLALAASAAVLFLVLYPPRPGGPLVVELRRERSGASVRGDFAPGDTLVIEVRPLARSAVAELRLYRGDGSLVLACDRLAPCARGAERLTARVPVAEAGLLRVLVVRAPAAPAAGRYDRDLAALIESGGEILFSRLLDVR